MKSYTLLAMYNVLFLGTLVSHTAENPAVADLICRMLKQAHAQETILPHLSDQDLIQLSQTCKPMQQFINTELERRQTQKAITIERASNAVAVNCRDSRKDFPNIQTFLQDILQKIEIIHTKNHGKWIRLHLGTNNLDNNDLQVIMPAIVSKVHKLGIDIVGLYFSFNQLTQLPENIFGRLTKLQTLDLDNNLLTQLHENIFHNLTQLQWLHLDNNQLTQLPENIFSGLTQLQVLTLNNNKLAQLPENIFRGLIQLGRLDLYNNQLTKLPENIFGGLTQLKWLDVYNNNLQRKSNAELHISPIVKVRWQ